MALYPGALPDFPWDSLGPARAEAARHAPVIDLSIGTPVDPCPASATEAMIAAVNHPGYPPAMGGERLEQAMAGWWERRRGAHPSAIIPTIGSKEMVALLPSFLSLGEGARVLMPARAYPTYEVGARLSGATPIAIDPEADPATFPQGDLLWINSPGNPDGHVLDRDQLRAMIAWARANSVIVASDECYAEIVPDGVEPAPSLLSSDVCGGDDTGLLALYSLSKQSNLAGYRAAMIAGDKELLAPIREARRHAGFMLPGPVIAAMTAVLADDDHVENQRRVYARRREILRSAVAAAGLEADPQTAAGLYLWLSAPGHDAEEIVSALASRGIIVAPGTFYDCDDHIRMSLTASDELIELAATRLATPLFD
ncbi:MAG: succinyldiaminopimelate transaminase [Flaviflexus sp.]|nr:succinyldiaminopimelate transaminase [Flaviflexus sp.]